MRRKKSFFARSENLLGQRDNAKGYIKGKLKFKEASLEELNALKIALIKRRKKQARITLLIAAISALFSIVLVSKFIANTKTVGNSIHQNQEMEKEKKYRENLAFGDEWLAKRHWTNALFFYRDAVEIIPNDIAAPTRIILTYCYACKDYPSFCDSARSKLEALKIRAPQDPRLDELEKALLEAEKKEH